MKSIKVNNNKEEQDSKEVVSNMIENKLQSSFTSKEKRIEQQKKRSAYISILRKTK